MRSKTQRTTLKSKYCNQTPTSAKTLRNIFQALSLTNPKPVPSKISTLISSRLPLMNVTHSCIIDFRRRIWKRRKAEILTILCKCLNSMKVRLKILFIRSRKLSQEKESPPGLIHSQLTLRPIRLADFKLNPRRNKMTKLIPEFCYKVLINHCSWWWRLCLNDS